MKAFECRNSDILELSSTINGSTGVLCRVGSHLSFYFKVGGHLLEKAALIG